MHSHYRFQGQTIPYVLVDIAKPPTGTLSLFNLYVALSEARGEKPSVYSAIHCS
ncbi:hypothetical protein B0H13DRAFT_1671990 [Mycena leptocephala]|nr:hypothetical protein B0H13DRAFT_1671990 [Mycena leptocephala]